MKKLLLAVLVILLVLAWYAPQSHKAEPSSQVCDTLLELPAISPDDIILRYTAMTVKYDTSRRIPSWVAYELTGEETDGDVPRASGFSMDLNFKGPQAMREDYSNSGWDKGHMAPAADMKWSKKAMYESFYLTNVCPQDHTMNAGPWLRLEKWCRDKALKYGSLYIVTGPIVGNCVHGTIGERKVAVPDKFFKALLANDNGTYRAIAFVMLNDTVKQSIPGSCITVDSLEKITGIDFFANLPDELEEMAESKMNYKLWAKETK